MGKPKLAKRNKVIPWGQLKDRKVRDLGTNQLTSVILDERYSREVRQAATAEYRYKRRKAGLSTTVPKIERVEPANSIPRKTVFCSACNYRTSMSISRIQARNKPRCPKCGGPLNLAHEA